MSQYTINIGLARNDGLPDNSLKDTIYQCWKNGLNIRFWKEARVFYGRWKGTEKTLVAVITGEPCPAVLSALCVILHQDCIAVKYVDGTGELIGPNADKWGKFNPEYFINWE